MEITPELELEIIALKVKAALATVAAIEAGVLAGSRGDALSAGPAAQLDASGLVGADV